MSFKILKHIDMGKDPNVYYVQFTYAGEEHKVYPLSYWDYSKGDIGDKLVLAEFVEDHIRENNLHKEGERVSNARLFGKGGELIVKVDDFSKIYDDEKN